MSNKNNISDCKFYNYHGLFYIVYDTYSIFNSVEFSTTKHIYKKFLDEGYFFDVVLPDVSVNDKLLSFFKDSLVLIKKTNINTNVNFDYRKFLVYNYMYSAADINLILDILKSRIFYYDFVITNNPFLSVVFNRFFIPTFVITSMNLISNRFKPFWMYEFYIKSLIFSDYFIFPSIAYKKKFLDVMSNYVSSYVLKKIDTNSVIGKPNLNCDLLNKYLDSGFSKRNKDGKFFKIGVLTPDNSFYNTDKIMNYFISLYSSGVSNFIVYKRRKIPGVNSYKSKFIEEFDFMPQSDFFGLIKDLDFVVIDCNSYEFVLIALESLYLGVPVFFKRYDWIYDIIDKDYPFVYDRISDISIFMNNYVSLCNRIDFDRIRNKILFYSIDNCVNRCFDFVNSVLSNRRTLYDIKKLLGKCYNNMEYIDINYLCKNIEVLNKFDGNSLFPLNIYFSIIKDYYYFNKEYSLFKIKDKKKL